jgi:threonine/homoserine/homoserine lactone efflux protein
MFDPLPYAAYSFVMAITPGPNNVMLTASGANFGFRRTVPHLLGVSTGCVIQLIAVYAGLGALFSRWPLLQAVLQWAGAVYLLWLGWKLVRSGEVAQGQAPEPISFAHAAAFQFVNPKAWVMSLSAVALFLPASLGMLTVSAYLIVMMAIINLPCTTVWALFGTALRGLLQRRAARLAFNVSMAVALVATGVIMVA